MSTSPHIETPSATVAPSSSNRRLLRLGVAIAPLFLLIAIAQMVFRPGFDLSRHTVSALQNGDFGWIQSGNFIISGALALLFAWGARNVMRGSRGGTWAPILFAVFGAGMIVAGVFPPDPAFGFPEGAPTGMPESTSAAGALHGAGFFGAFIPLIASCFVMARHFGSRARSWSVYSLAVGLATPILIAVGTAFTEHSGLFAFAVGVVSFTWLSVVAGRLR